jgi:hypothetical protein
MRFSQVYCGVLPLVAAVSAQETIWASYIFHRHGDRTSKSTPPATLTNLGFEEVLSSGTYYHNRYVSSESPFHIVGLSNSTVKLAQVSAVAPWDNVIMSSGIGFLQGLYPAVETTQTLANGTNVTAPNGGYQFIPIDLVEAGTASEDTGWLQDATGCLNAAISSNNYFFSAEYKTLLNSTAAFYQRLDPVTNATFASSYMTYKNAYLSKSLSCVLASFI